jgi:hypothetical protein
MKMNTKNRLCVKAIVLCAVFFVLTGCPTAFKDLSAEDEIMEELIPTLVGGAVVAKIEAESGKLTSLNNGDQPAIYTGGAASGRSFVKNIGELQGYVDLTVPAGVTEGAYGLTLVWSGSATGTVAVTINPATVDSPATKVMAYIRSSDEWDMNDPKYLKMFEPEEEEIPQIKAGDIIRIHNARLGDAQVSKWLHLDVVYLWRE